MAKISKRFTIRKIKKYFYSRQGWRLKDNGHAFVIYDREWKKRIQGYIGGIEQDFSSIKYIEEARSKEVAQFWADWLNTNCAENFNREITIPMSIFREGLKLFVATPSES